MKIIAAALLSILTIPAYAQSVMGALQTFQKDLTSESKASPKGAPGQQPTVQSVAKTKSSGQCLENDQTSIPLTYLTNMMLERDAKLDIVHDNLSGELIVNSPPMISNCSSMIEWEAKSRVQNGVTSYVVEAKIKKGDSCVDGVCAYDVVKGVKDESTDEFKKSVEKVHVAPTFKGFESCLEKAGVIVKTKDPKTNKVTTSVEPKAISAASLNEKFDGMKESGVVLFLSHGLESREAKAKYGSFVEVDKCDHYENILPEPLKLLSSADEAARAEEARKAEMRECKDYMKLTKFMEESEALAQEFGGIRDNLIIEGTKKAVAAITAGDKSVDISVIADFQKHIIEPLVDQADVLYNMIQIEKDPAKKSELVANLKQVLTALSKYNSAPFMTTAIVEKLESLGEFERAQDVNGIKALIVTRARLGSTIAGKVITPALAQKEVENYRKLYAAESAEKKLKYEARTGQRVGDSKIFADQMANRTRMIQVRTQNYSRAIAEEYAKMQRCPQKVLSGFLPNYAQRCIQESQANIQALQASLQRANQLDAAEGQKLAAKATEFAKLEKEGQAYIAQNSGAEEVEVDTTIPVIPGANNQVYTFDYQGAMGQNQMGQQQTQQMSPQQLAAQQQYQYMASPNQFQSSQNPYLQGQTQQFPNYMGHQQYQSQQYPTYMGQQQSFNPYMQQQQQPNYGNSLFGAQFNIGATGYTGNQYNQYMQGQTQQYPNYMGQQQSYNPYMMGSYNMYAR